MPPILQTVRNITKVHRVETSKNVDHQNFVSMKQIYFKVKRTVLPSGPQQITGLLLGITPSQQNNDVEDRERER